MSGIWQLGFIVQLQLWSLAVGSWLRIWVLCLRSVAWVWIYWAVGLGSEVSLGVALGSLGLCGVHVHFYKFIVVGSKSMPRGVSPKVGVWWWRKLQCKYLNLKTEWLWAQKGCWEAQHCHRWSMKQHTVCRLSSAASQSRSSRAVRRPRSEAAPGQTPSPAVLLRLLRSPGWPFISSLLGCICTWRSESWKRSPSEIRLGEHRKGLWWCHHNRLDYYYF